MKPIVFSLIIKIFTITCVTSTAISNVNFVFEVFSQKSLVRFFEFNDIGWNISQSCVQNLYSYLDALQKDLKWAYKLLDSSGNYAGGLFYGQHLRPANPEQCNEINKELNSIISDNTNYESVNTLSIVPFFVHLVNAKYSTYVDDQRQEIQQTVCMPASCTYEDLMQIMSYTSLLPHQLLKDTELVELRILYQSYKFYSDINFIIITAIASVILVFTISISSYECYYRSKMKVLKHDKFHRNIMINDLNKVGDSRSKIDKIETKHPAITSSGVNEKPQGVENNERRICKCKTANYKMNEKTDSLTISNKACNHMNLVKLEKNKIDKTITITLDNCVVPNRRRKNLMNQDVQGRIFEFSFQNQLSVIDSSDSSFDRVDLNRSFHVMKCFALFWILFLNVTTTLSYAANNLRYIESKGESFIANFIFKNGSLSINTFFFINGVALCQMFFTSSKDLGIHKIKGVSKHLQHYIFLIVYKIFKLFLPYITTIHLLRMFMKYFNENSILTIPSNDHFTCENIFTKLAFLDLYSPYSERCMLWTWYLSTEIQFFAISLLILMLSRNHPRYAFTIFVSFYLSTFYTTTTINVETNRVTHISKLTGEEKLMFFNGIYEHPILHLGPYLVGIFFGCLSCNLNKKVKINSVCLSIGWIIALTLYCLVSFYKVDNVNNLWMKYGFFALSHTFWALILLWISFVTMTSSGGFFDIILTSKIIQLISKISNTTLLLHPLIIRVFILSTNNAIFLSFPLLVVTFVGLAAISIMASLTFYICFETPITTTLHIMYKKLVESQNE